MLLCQIPGLKFSAMSLGKSRPKFSILMANFNNGKFIETAIKSVQSQLFRDWELIIIDDCSTDNSVEVINRYLNDFRIKLTKNTHNRGYISALKSAIKLSDSPFLGILDSDDALEGGAIGSMYRAHVKNKKAGLIYSQFKNCDNDLCPISVGFCDKIPEKSSNIFYDKISHFKTFKKEAYLKTSGYNEKILYAEDKDLILKIEEVSEVLFVNKIFYRYRVLNNSQSHDKIKCIISRASYVLAKYDAYKRRVGSNFPNFSRKEMSNELLKGFIQSIVIKDLKRSKYFLLESFKLSPFNLFGLIYVIYGLIFGAIRLFFKKGVINTNKDK